MQRGNFCVAFSGGGKGWQVISSLSAGRTDANGIADDENVYARLTLKTTYTPFTGNYLQEPSVTIGGNYESVTWYHNWSSSTGFSNPVDWTNYAPASPVTIYGQVSGTYADTQSYPVSVTVSTTYKSATKSITLVQSFYLLSGRPGGKGLGIGMKPTGNNLYIGMNTISKGTLTIENHSTPIGSAITSGTESGISISTGGALKATGITVTIPAGVWIISYYGAFGQNVANSTYKGIALRYRTVGESTWTTWIQSQMTVGSWSSASEVNPAIAACAVTEVEEQRVFELMARTNTATSTFSGRIVAFRIA